MGHTALPGARPTTCTLARRTRGRNICIFVSDGSERARGKNVKYGYDIKIQFRRVAAFSIIRGKHRGYFLDLSIAIYFCLVLQSHEEACKLLDLLVKMWRAINMLFMHTFFIVIKKLI